MQSFDYLKVLYNEVKQTVNTDKVLIFVVGNKNDLYEHEKVKKEDAEEFTKSINGIYRCVSALESTGINELFLCIGKTLLNEEEREKSLEKDPSTATNNNNNQFSLKKEEEKPKDIKKKKCC